ncbi:MAG TPA: 2-C-methyl-D-erythritol 2,4-cyclodiphosphate synthase [Gemmatimonadales bacterium]|nr:2-C-methyl-D-erythritol 2,4-cyclodiphosphate synthase [Gemmatimonadales bacterium]
MIRVGIGYDSHRFAPGRPFILGGQRIAFDQGLQAHSDGDAVAHAVTDAILGAAAAGDMGAMFPDSDPQWKDADSLMLLRLARERISQLGFRPVQADVTVICEKPHLGVYKEAMAAAIADELGIPADAVGMKAKTNEGMGFVGRGEGVAVFAVALVEDR